MNGNDADCEQKYHLSPLFRFPQPPLYFAEWEVKHSKNALLYKNLEQQKLDEFIDSSIYLAVKTLQKSKFEVTIYDAIAEEDQEMRMLHYALFLGKCKREVVRFSDMKPQRR